MNAPTFLVQLLPPRWEPFPGQRIRWPGEDVERVWTGARWEEVRVAFDGGDAWEQDEELLGGAEAA